MSKKMKLKGIRCPYCGSIATLRESRYVYGDDNFGGHLYVCSKYPVCNSYVSVNERTLQPMGPLANGDLRHMRIEAHRAFDRIWRSGIMTRSDAYRWMQARFGLKPSQAHISQFSTYLCQAIINESNLVLQANHKQAS